MMQYFFLIRKQNDSAASLISCYSDISKNVKQLRNRKGWQHVIIPTTTRPINYIPRDQPMNVPKRKRERGENSEPRKRPRLDPAEENRKLAILAPTTISRPDVDPEVPLDEGEHPSCGKVVGAPTAQKMTREALAEHRYRLVV